MAKCKKLDNGKCWTATIRGPQTVNNDLENQTSVKNCQYSQAFKERNEEIFRKFHIGKSKQDIPGFSEEVVTGSQWETENKHDTEILQR